MVTSWAIRHNHPEVDLPAAYAATWGLKRKGAFDAAEFWKAYTTDMFGVALPGFGNAAALAEKGAGLSFLLSHFREKAGNISQGSPPPFNTGCCQPYERTGREIRSLALS